MGVPVGDIDRMVRLAVAGVDMGSFTASADGEDYNLVVSVPKTNATATLDASGHATVIERIDYHFPQHRHGIYRLLPDVPLTMAPAIHVSADTYDDTLVTPEGNGVRVRIGDPGHTISGDHRYLITYPLDTVARGGDRYAWNGVGLAWTVPIEPEQPSTTTRSAPAAWALIAARARRSSRRPW